MELDDRIAKIEARLAEDDKIEWLERKGLRVAKCALLIIAVAAPITWALFEFVLFVINRWETLIEALYR